MPAEAQQHAQQDDRGKADAPPAGKSDASPKKRHSRLRILLVGLSGLVIVLGVVRLMLPQVLRWYVNRTIDQSLLYDGRIGDIDVSLWRGAYSINDIRLLKVTGNVPVPLFAARRLDLAVQWPALMHGRLVGRIVMQDPELNFVDSDEESRSQTGAGGPWLEIIQDLFPFKINSALVHNGSIHFRAFDTDPPVDVYLSEVEASVQDLTNVRDQTTPLVATVTATALAMDQARFEYQMKVDPFSYRPTFDLAVRLLGLDVTKTNSLARAYGAFDFEHGWFDLVVELHASEGQVRGYVKPLFRDLQVISLKKDIPEENILQVFWEALVGTATALLQNQPRDQFGTVIPLHGDLTGPKTSILAVVGNVLRNAFIRAYLPRLEGGSTIDTLQFGRAQPLIESDLIQ